MAPERQLEHAEAVRIAYATEKKLKRLTVKVASGHEHLTPYRDRLAARLGRTA